MPLAAVAVWIVGLVVAMWTTARLLQYFSTKHKTRNLRIQRTALFSFVGLFVFSRYNTPLLWLLVFLSATLLLEAAPHLSKLKEKANLRLF